MRRGLMLRAISFIALAMAIHAGLGTMIVFFFNDSVTKYSEPVRLWWEQALSVEASIGLSLIFLCYFVAWRVVK